MLYAASFQWKAHCYILAEALTMLLNLHRLQKPPRLDGCCPRTSLSAANDDRREVQSCDLLDAASSHGTVHDMHAAHASCSFKTASLQYLRHPLPLPEVEYKY